MCGFCGFSGENQEQEKVITAMMDRIIHRGPDSAGIYLGDNMTLGFRRLAIVSVGEDGTQPMYNENKNLVMVFNGEIYNYQELRSSLEEKGHVFSSNADSETILHMYEEYGYGMLTHLRGMFAFAIYNILEDKLFCARDPFGIKPFYYTKTDEGLIFGSEIKSFLEHPSFTPAVNIEALGQYLTFQYSVLTETFFKGVYKLPPGHYLTLDSTNEGVTITRYHSHIFTPVDTELETSIENIDQVVKESVAKHMASDVEIGSFLSSGVDSSYVAACFAKEGAKRQGIEQSPINEATMSLPEGSVAGVSPAERRGLGQSPTKMKTFTVGFDYEQYNEIGYASRLSEKLGVENISKIISTEEYWECLPKFLYHLDEPLADPAAVALYFVSREAAKHVKCTFSGEGADELFGGYNIYKEPLSLHAYSKLPLSLREWLASCAKKLPKGMKGRNFLIRGAKTVEERYIGGAYVFTPEERNKLLKHIPLQDPIDITRPYYEQVKHEDDITKMQYLDIHLWQAGDILLKADKMSMAHGLEVRVPLLDKEVFKVASRLPVKHRVTRKSTKYAFRQAAKRHLPPEVAEKRKLGFPVPVRIWLREEKYYNIVKEHFTSDTAQKYFHTNLLVDLLDEHYNGKHDNGRKIWTIFMFLLWHKEFFARG